MSMNIGPKTCVLALSLAGALTMNGPLTQARAQETHFSELANLPFAEGRPTAETTQKVHDELPAAQNPGPHLLVETLYDAENSSGLANGQPFPSLGSRDKPTQNADGSTDLYFGPKAPEGIQGNWLATLPGKAYFVILRLYGPAESAIDKSWKPSDITLVK